MKQTFMVFLIALVALGVSPVWAQSNGQATIGLYVVPENDAPRQLCSEESRDCEDAELRVSGRTYESYVVYICVFNGDPVTGVAGLEFALDYDGSDGSGVDIFQEIMCSDLNFASSNWPADGSTAAYAWDTTRNCQRNEPGGAGTGVTAVAGALTVFAYSPDRMSILPKPSGHVNVVDCNAAYFTVEPERRGSVAFSEDGSEEGNPGCTRAVLQDTEWGEVKKTYEKNNR